MNELPQFVVAGVPLILIVFAIVEEIKAYGLSGNILRVCSLLVGFLLAFFVALATDGMPAELGGWVTLVIVGIVYGLTASGAYDFLNARWSASG